VSGCSKPPTNPVVELWKECAHALLVVATVSMMAGSDAIEAGVTSRPTRTEGVQRKYLT
jgi:hypothetical protein